VSCHVQKTEGPARWAEPRRPFAELRERARSMQHEGNKPSEPGRRLDRIVAEQIRKPANAAHRALTRQLSTDMGVGNRCQHAPGARRRAHALARSVYCCSCRQMNSDSYAGQTDGSPRRLTIIQTTAPSDRCRAAFRGTRASARSGSPRNGRSPRRPRQAPRTTRMYTGRSKTSTDDRRRSVRPARSA
jgi:hypothetical protein